MTVHVCGQWLQGVSQQDGFRVAFFFSIMLLTLHNSVEQKFQEAMFKDLRLKSADEGEEILLCRSNLSSTRAR